MHDLRAILKTGMVKERTAAANRVAAAGFLRFFRRENQVQHDSRDAASGNSG